LSDKQLFQRGMWSASNSEYIQTNKSGVPLCVKVFVFNIKVL